MTDSRKPMAPDRPGRYLLRKPGLGPAAISVHHVDGDESYGAIVSGHWHKGEYRSHDDGPGNSDYDIVSMAPDDAAWCVAQARLLCPPSHAVVPVEPTQAMLFAGHNAAESVDPVITKKLVRIGENVMEPAYRAMVKASTEGEVK